LGDAGYIGRIGVEVVIGDIGRSIEGIGTCRVDIGKSRGDIGKSGKIIVRSRMGDPKEI
jgi:hypothetical protein